MLTGAAAVVAAAYAAMVRPRMLRWGATDKEVDGPFPGSELIPGGRRGTTMAITIDAPPEAVWPWLTQMGCNRAGWYSWDRLDNGGSPSASEIHPEWQGTELGDRLDSVPSGRSWFEIVALEPNRFLGLRAPLDATGAPFDTAGVRPLLYTDSLWGFWLRELPGGATRLVVSGYAATRPRLLYSLVDRLFWEPAHWVMQARQLTSLKQLVETA
jgi:proline iminopeptidase